MPTVQNPYRQLKRTASAAPPPAPSRGAPSRQPASRTASVEQDPQPSRPNNAPPPPKGVKLARREHFASQHDEQNHDPAGNFNPPSYGGFRDDIQSAIGNRRARMFDDNGQINAYDNKDALQQIAYLLQNVTKKASPGVFYREASKMDPEERRKVLAAAMTDPTGEGFAIVGQELLLPIKDIIDYEGWARKFYRVRTLAQGELFRIAKDVRSTAWVVGQDGQSIESRVYGKYIQPNEFKVTSFPTVDIEDIYQMNFDVLDRAQDTARQEVELEEDKRGLSLVDRAALTVNAVTAFTTLSVSSMEDIRYQVERHRLIVSKFLINRAEVSDLVKTATGTAGTGHVDPVTERELILAGYVGNVLNAQIITAAGTGVEEVVPKGTVYSVTDADYLGEMGVRVELFSEPFNMFSQRRLVKGWAFGEIIGFGIPTPRAASKGLKS